jgi:DNA anti-recombination protein RmuC
MSKHDEIRRILHESGFRFKDSERTALDMTDEEVDEWLTKFGETVTVLAGQMAAARQRLTAAFTRALVPLRDLGKLLEENPPEAN